MENSIVQLQVENIENRIFVIRNQQVMIDRDLALLYGVETKRLNEQVKRNIERFPERFMFQLTKEEQEYYDRQRSQIATLEVENNGQSLRSQIATLNDLKSQNATSNMRGKYSKYLSYAFTEQGVAMLSSVLRSETAVQVSIRIMDAFVTMRRFLQNNAQIFVELGSIKQHLIESDLHHKENDQKIERLFTLMDRYKIEDKQGVFFQGQIFDAYAKFESFIQQAKKEIILIDQYVDLTVLERLAKKQKGVAVTIYTSSKASLTAQDVQQFNKQYPTLTICHTSTMHDRFLIIDRSIIYHIGASLKDLGKKCFAFEILEDASTLIPAILANV
jgi:phage regulator Rha-like protein